MIKWKRKFGRHIMVIDKGGDRTWDPGPEATDDWEAVVSVFRLGVIELEPQCGLWRCKVELPIGLHHLTKYGDGSWYGGDRRSAADARDEAEAIVHGITESLVFAVEDLQRALD